MTFVRNFSARELSKSGVQDIGLISYSQPDQNKISIKRGLGYCP